MQAAFVIFNRMTALDFVGIYDPVTRLKSMHLLPEFEWRICGYTDPVVDDRGLQFVPDQIQGSLALFDMVIVPGGFGTRELAQDSVFLEWLRTAQPCPLKLSVCTGALLLGAAGFLRGKRATTHASALEQLAPFCQSVVTERIVDEGEVITSGGVTAGIDLGLYLVERLAGSEARVRVSRQMDYPHEHERFPP